MRLVELEVAGAYRVELQPIRDERGSFARSYCAEVFAAHALAPSFVQANISDNDRRGTLRGLHYQAAPHAEAKLIRCVRGAAWVAVLDLRRSSPSWREPYGLARAAPSPGSRCCRPSASASCCWCSTTTST